MTEATEDKYALVDDAGRRFTADAEVIIKEYRDESAKLVAERDEALAESKRIEAEAEAKYAKAVGRVRAQCVTRIQHAASIRAKKSEHPEDMDEACKHYVQSIETNGSTLEAESIMKALQMSAEARQLRAEAERKAQRRIALKRRVIDSDWRRSTYRI